MNGVVVALTLCLTGSTECSEYTFHKKDGDVTMEQCQKALPMAIASIVGTLPPELTFKSARCKNVNEQST